MNAGRTLRATRPSPNERAAKKTCYWQPSGQGTLRHLATLELDFPYTLVTMLHAAVVTNSHCLCMQHETAGLLNEARCGIWEVEFGICRLCDINWFCAQRLTKCTVVFGFIRQDPPLVLLWSLYVPPVVTICTASGHYMYRTVVTICTAQWSLYVPHSGHYMYRQLNIKQFYVLPPQCIYVFCVDLRTNSDCFPIQH